MAIKELDTLRNKYPDMYDGMGEMDDLTLATSLAKDYPQYSYLIDTVKAQPEPITIADTAIRQADKFMNTGELSEASLSYEAPEIEYERNPELERQEIEYEGTDDAIRYGEIRPQTFKEKYINPVKQFVKDQPLYQVGKKYLETEEQQMAKPIENAILKVMKAPREQISKFLDVDETEQPEWLRDVAGTIEQLPTNIYGGIQNWVTPSGIAELYLAGKVMGVAGKGIKAAGKAIFPKFPRTVQTALKTDVGPGFISRLKKSLNARMPAVQTEEAIAKVLQRNPELKGAFFKQAKNDPMLKNIKDKLTGREPLLKEGKLEVKPTPKPTMESTTKEIIPDVKKSITPEIKAPTEAIKPVQEAIKPTEVVYHGTPDYTKKQEAVDGELGKGLYFTRNKSLAENYAQPRGEVYDTHEALKTSKVIEKDISNLNIKQIGKEEYLKDRKKFYDEEQALNNGEWDKNVARRAEAKLEEEYKRQGYDGLEVKEEQQGVIFEEIKPTEAIQPQEQSLIEEAKEPEMPKKLIGQKSTKVSKGQLPVGEGAKKASKLASRISETLEATPEGSKTLVPEFKKMNNKQQIESAVKYVTENPKEAIQVLRGRKEAPEGLLYNSIALALEEHAIDVKDASMIIDIASLRSTRYGQEIQILREANKESPVKYISDLKKRRIEAFGDEKVLKSQKKASVKSLKETIKKSNPTRGDWMSFIDSIEC